MNLYSARVSKKTWQENFFFATIDTLIGKLAVADKSPDNAACINMSRNAFFSLRSEKTISLTLILW